MHDGGGRELAAGELAAGITRRIGAVTSGRLAKQAVLRHAHDEPAVAAVVFSGAVREDALAAEKAVSRDLVERIGVELNAAQFVGCVHEPQRDLHQSLVLHQLVNVHRHAVYLVLSLRADDGHQSSVMLEEVVILGVTFWLKLMFGEIVP